MQRKRGDRVGRCTFANPTTVRMLTMQSEVEMMLMMMLMMVVMIRMMMKTIMTVMTQHAEEVVGDGNGATSPRLPCRVYARS